MCGACVCYLVDGIIVRAWNVASADQTWLWTFVFSHRWY